MKSDKFRFLKTKPLQKTLSGPSATYIYSNKTWTQALVLFRCIGQKSFRESRLSTVTSQRWERDNSILMCSLMKKWKGTSDSNIYENIILVINVLFFSPWEKLVYLYMVSSFCLTSEFNMTRPEECTQCILNILLE